MYRANFAAVEANEIGQESNEFYKLYYLLGELVFEVEEPDKFLEQPYWFTTEEELRTDLHELRSKATILLDTSNREHSVGLKPCGDNPDEWQIVGTHQIVAVQPGGGKVEVQHLREPPIITTSQVWEYLKEHNQPGTTKFTALIFPPEPK